MAMHKQTGKPKLSMVPRSALVAIAQVFEHVVSSGKYPRDNWRLGRDHLDWADSALRHITDYVEGKDKDDESGLHPIKHALTDLAILLDNIESGVGTDDRWKQRGLEGEVEEVEEEAETDWSGKTSGPALNWIDRMLRFGAVKGSLSSPQPPSTSLTFHRHNYLAWKSGLPQPIDGITSMHFHVVDIGGNAVWMLAGTYEPGHTHPIFEIGENGDGNGNRNGNGQGEQDVGQPRVQ